jgi:hypothetical protein
MDEDLNSNAVNMDEEVDRSKNHLGSESYRTCVIRRGEGRRMRIL